MLELGTRKAARHDPLSPRPLVRARARRARDQGFGPLSGRSPTSSGCRIAIQIELDVEPAEDAHGARSGRDLPDHPRGAAPGDSARASTRVSVGIADVAGGGIEAVIADDAPGERRRASFDAIAERARSLSGRMSVDPGPDGGTSVRILFPPYESVARLAAPMASRALGYCLFISKPTGYELIEPRGRPAAGRDHRRARGQGSWVVNRISAVAAPAGPAAVRVPPAGD